MGWTDRGKLQRRADELGITVSELVDRAIKKYGTPYKAAIHLDVYPYAITKFLKKREEDKKGKQK